MFIRKKGGPTLYFVYQIVYLYGKITFKGNKGGSIYSKHSNIMFNRNAIVIIHQNKAERGAAIHSVKGSKISFEDNSVVNIVAPVKYCVFSGAHWSYIF